MQFLTIQYLANIDEEAAAFRCSAKWLFLKISQNSQESNCALVCFE